MFVLNGSDLLVLKTRWRLGVVWQWHTCHIEGISTVRIKFSDGIVRELKDMRYVPQLNKNLISIVALEAQGLKGTLGEGVLKMFSSSLVVLKGIRHNNLYSLKSRAVTENLAALEQLKDDYQVVANEVQIG